MILVIIKLYCKLFSKDFSIKYATIGQKMNKLLNVEYELIDVLIWDVIGKR
jgi:hypothetical protein